MSAFTIPVLLIGLVAIILVVHKQYDDGLVGRLALSAIILGSFVIVLQDIIEDIAIEVSNEILLLVWPFAVFMIRHLYRFLRFTHGDDTVAWINRPK